MAKSILLLINGFGVEKKGSAEIYSAKLMPNMDYMTKNYLFGSLSTKAGDFNNGYRLFSIPEKGKKVDDQIDNLIYDKKLGSIETIGEIASGVGEGNNLHLFYIFETGIKFHQVREFCKVLNPTKQKKLFIHLIMTATSTTQYDEIIKMISKLSFESGGFGKVGFVVGKNKLNTDDTLRTFYKEYGEHWNESTKKFEILKKEIVNPDDANIFYINSGFSLKENDTVLFMNFENVDMERFYNNFTKVPVKKYSLYEMREDVKNIFIREADERSTFASIVQKFGLSILTFTNPKRLNDINFYLHGMKKTKIPNLTYATYSQSLFESKERVIDLIERSGYDGYILDFDIGNYNKVADIKNELSSIDVIIKNISEASKEKGYTFIISSLYGMYAPVMDGVIQKVINFSERVPCVFQNNEFNKADYSLSGGTIYALSETYLTSIKDEVGANRLVHKLGKLDKLLSRKK